MNEQQQPIEDLLHNAKPQADPAFQHNLEEHLLARLHEKYDKHEENPTMTNMKRKNSAPRSRLPLTLAAAIIAIVLVGGLIIMLNRTSTNAASFASPSLEPDNPFALTATRLVVQATAIAQCPQDDSNGVSIITVQEGDTLVSLGAQFELPVESLIEANCLVKTSALTVGQALRIPNSAIYDPTPLQVFDLTVTAVVRNATEAALISEMTTFTPTPAPMNPNDETSIPIMIAARDIAVGQIITAEMVYRVYWTRSVASAAIEQNPDFGGLFGDWSDVIGRQAESVIPQWHPIQAEMIDSSTPGIVLDQGMVAIAASINQVTSSGLVHVSDIYDIFITCLELQPPLATSEAGSIVDIGGSDCGFAINNAEILFIGKVDEAPDYIPRPTVDTALTNIAITIAVRAEDAQRIAEALDSGARLSLQPSNTIP